MSAEKFSRRVLLSSSVIWFVYGFLAGFGRWPFAVGFGLIAGLCLVVIVLISAKIVVKLTDWTLVGYFAIAAAATFVVPIHAFPRYASVVIWSMFSVMTWASILIGRPFTLQFARESAPREHWESPEFLRTNLIISAFWGMAFLLNLVLVIIALTPADHLLVTGVIAPILSLVGASIFTSRYTRIVRARARAAA